MQEARRPSLESEEKTGKSGGQGGRDQSEWEQPRDRLLPLVMIRTPVVPELAGHLLDARGPA